MHNAVPPRPPLIMALNKIANFEPITSQLHTNIRKYVLKIMALNKIANFELITSQLHTNIRKYALLFYIFSNIFLLTSKHNVKE
jgi:hypothetical protein